MDTSTERAEKQPLVPHLGRNKRSVAVLAYVAVLIFSLVGGSVFWLVRANNLISGHTNKNHVLAAATLSPTWIPTVITPPAAATFYDTFVNNEHGWSLSGTNGDLRMLTNNLLILANLNPNATLIESVPTSTTLNNYVVSIDFTLNQGDAHDSTGLYVRGDSLLDHDYRINIIGNKTVDIAKEWLDSTQTPQSTMLVSPQTTKLLNPPGNPNTLTVFLIDQTITVLLNNVTLTTITDSAYSSGQVALFVQHGSNPKGAIFSFSRVEIDHLASPFATPGPTFHLIPNSINN